MRDALIWSTRLEALARPVLADMPQDPSASADRRRDYAAAFRDECNVRRPTDLPLLAHLLGIDPDLPMRQVQRADAGSPAWTALLDPTSNELRHYLSTTGPLVPERRDEGIETWTETELSELHALGAIAILRKDALIADRCRSAIEWHLAELQPDNGTNRPWAVHAFAWFADQLPDAIFHANTLVHNACVERGRPERRSALILMHSSMILRLAAAREA